MKIKLFLAGALMLLLAGCLDPNETLNEKRINYINRDAAVLFLSMGVPQEEGKIAGLKYYAWTYHDAGSYTLPQYNTSSYTETTQSSDGEEAKTTGTYDYTTYTTKNYNYNCVMRAFVDRNNRVIKFDINGDTTGCNQLVNRL